MLFLYCPLVSTYSVLSHPALQQKGSLYLMGYMTLRDKLCRLWMTHGCDPPTTTRCRYCFQTGSNAK